MTVAAAAAMGVAVREDVEAATAAGVTARVTAVVVVTEAEAPAATLRGD